jgi:hypothetical protein
VPKVTLAQSRSCFLEPTRSPDTRAWHPFGSLPPPARSLRHRHRQHPPLRSGQRPASICDRRQMMKVANGGFVEIRGDCPKARKWPTRACHRRDRPCSRQMPAALDPQSHLILGSDAGRWLHDTAAMDDRAVRCAALLTLRRAICARFRPSAVRTGRRRFLVLQRRGAYALFLEGRGGKDQWESAPRAPTRARYLDLNLDQAAKALDSSTPYLLS